jgi:hypothetical protein
VVEQRFCKPLVGSSNLSPGTSILNGTHNSICWLVDQVKEINMPMLFWLPAIIVSGWWSMFAKELDVQAARQSGNAGPSR